MDLTNGAEDFAGSLTQTWYDADEPPSVLVLGTFAQSSAVTLWLGEQAEATGQSLESVELKVQDDQAVLLPRGWGAEGLDLTGTVTWE